MLTKLGNEIEELTENFNKELESIINNQAELKNTMTEMKNTLGGINTDYLIEKNREVTQRMN